MQLLTNGPHFVETEQLPLQTLRTINLWQVFYKTRKLVRFQRKETHWRAALLSDMQYISTILLQASISTDVLPGWGSVEAFSECLGVSTAALVQLWLLIIGRKALFSFSLGGGHINKLHSFTESNKMTMGLIAGSTVLFCRMRGKWTRFWIHGIEAAFYPTAQV